MLHAVYNATVAERQHWMGVLARADIALLEEGLAACAAQERTQERVWLRRPETGLTMLRARAGGTGDRFNFGEMTVTRCALRLPGGVTGVAYVQGRSHRKAELAALADALLQVPATRDAVLESVVAPAERAAAARAAAMHRRAQATRVEFFTVAREAGA